MRVLSVSRLAQGAWIEADAPVPCACRRSFHMLVHVHCVRGARVYCERDACTGVPLDEWMRMEVTQEAPQPWCERSGVGAEGVEGVEGVLSVVGGHGAARPLELRALHYVRVDTRAARFRHMLEGAARVRDGVLCLEGAPLLLHDAVVLHDDGARAELPLAGRRDERTRRVDGVGDGLYWCVNARTHDADLVALVASATRCTVVGALLLIEVLRCQLEASPPDKPTSMARKVSELRWVDGVWA